MKLGAMTNPQRELPDELRQIAAEGFDFADITLEAPRAEPQQIDVTATRRLLDELGIGVVCHAAPYLPVHNPAPLVRRAALDELRRSLDVAASLGARLLTTHYMGFPGFWPEAAGYARCTPSSIACCAARQRSGVCWWPWRTATATPIS